VPSDQSIVAQLIPTVSKTPGFDQRAVDFTLQAVATGRLPAYTEERCASIKPLDKKTLITNLSASVTSSLATGAASAAAAGASSAAAAGASSSPGMFAALAPAAPFLIVGAVVLGVVAAIFAHHAKAVAAEQSTMCAAVPAANEGLAWIDAEFQAGRMAKPDAIAALDSLLQNFTQYVRPVMKESGTRQCNLACGYNRALTAIVTKKRAEYAEAPDAVLASILSGDGWKGLLPWAIGGALLLKFAA
jgi:hypothetical protein